MTRRVRAPRLSRTSTLCTKSTKILAIWNARSVLTEKIGAAELPNSDTRKLRWIDAIICEVSSLINNEGTFFARISAQKSPRISRTFFCLYMHFLARSTISSIMLHSAPIRQAQRLIEANVAGASTLGPDYRVHFSVDTGAKDVSCLSNYQESKYIG